MSDRMLANLVMVFGLIGLLIGTGTLASDKQFFSGCQRGCWLEPLLYVFLGEQWGKRMLVTFWYVAGLWVFCIGLRMRKKARAQRNGQLLRNDHLKP